MSPVVTERKKARRRRRRRPSGRGFPFRFLAWWPLVLALVATPFAVRAASVLALSGPGALRLLFPFVALAQAHAPASFAPEQRDVLAEWTMWAQFPVYGLVIVLIGKWRGIAEGLLAVVCLHGVAVVADVLFVH